MKRHHFGSCSSQQVKETREVCLLTKALWILYCLCLKSKWPILGTFLGCTWVSQLDYSFYICTVLDSSPGSMFFIIFIFSQMSLLFRTQYNFLIYIKMIKVKKVKQRERYVIMLSGWFIFLSFSHNHNVFFHLFSYFGLFSSWSSLLNPSSILS